MAMRNAEVVDLLQLIGDLMELRGDEAFGLRHFGPSRIAKAHQALGVATLDELEAAARDGRLERVPGFGKRSVETLLVSIQGFRERRRTIPRYVAEATAWTAAHALRQMANLAQVEVAGAIRRKADLVADVDLVAAGDDLHAIVEAFFKLPLLRDGERLGASDTLAQAVARTRE